VDERLVREHLDRLDASYFQRFSTEDIVRHLRGLARIEPGHPVEVLAETGPDSRVNCTVLAFDYPGEFSLITGIMAGLGFNIISGGIHTYARVQSEPVKRFRRSWTDRQPDPWHRRRIVDHFSGSVQTELSLEEWTRQFRQEMEQVFGLLERQDDASAAEAKARVNEKVARRLAGMHPDTQSILFPVQIDIDNEAGPFTRLRVLSEDTPAFLYAFSNALSLRGISIEHVKIMTHDRRIEDSIDFVNARGEKITDPAALDQVKFSVLLTKQFTYFLGRSPDPFSALLRFENLVADVLELPESGKWVELLSNPRILQDLARLLGTSDFLWEDMIRQQYETLLPMLAPHVEGRQFSQPLETLPERLEQVLDGAKNYEDKQRQLNAFKDQEIFRIDLDHILTPGADFHVLAEHLTYLAEQVVRQSVRGRP